MTLTRIVFLIVALLFMTFSLGLWPGQDLTVESDSLWLGIFLFAGFAFIIFRTQIWAGDAGKGNKPMTIVLKTSKSPADVMKEIFWARMFMIGIGVVVALILIEYMGYHDVLMQALDWIAAKGEKLVNALLQ